MLKKLPNRLDVHTLAKNAKEITFTIPRKALARLAEAVNSIEEDATGVLRFSLFEGRYPQVGVQVSTSVCLICQRNLSVFQYELIAETCLVFADDEDAEWLSTHEVLLPEDMDENPQVWIEDSLLLALPLVPVQPGSQPVELQVGEVIEEAVKPNPFANLKAMLQKE